MNDIEKIKFDIKELSKDDNGVSYHINIKIPLSLGYISDALFIAFNDSIYDGLPLKHTKNQDGYAIFDGETYLYTSALYHFYFSFYANGNLIYFKKNNIDNYRDINKSDMWKLSVNYETPSWAKGKIMYHIFVDRFNRKSNKIILPNRHLYPSFDSPLNCGCDSNGIWNNDFYGGDLEGIIDKLDYIRSLGVSILYLSPIVKSQSNHRYDTGDYLEIDPYVGSPEDLERLCSEAHKRGMKVILDAVFNHTGNDSKYFNEFNNYDSVGAYQSKDSPYYDFYRKHECDGKTYFDYWWQMPNLPECQGDKWEEFICGCNGVIDKWFSLGIDGLRLDVADELSDGFISKIRDAVKRNKTDGFILGEVWKDPTQENRGYLLSGHGMDSVMNYNLIDALIRYFKYSDVSKLRNKINDLFTNYPDDVIKCLMNFTSTHDISRIINIFATNDFKYDGEWAWNLNDDSLEFAKNFKLSSSDYRKGVAIYKAYLFFLTFFPGILSIFYGDEVGLTGIGNLYNRAPFPWNNMDHELLNYIRNIGFIRDRERFLENADTNIFDINDHFVMFERMDDDNNLLITINRTNEEISMPLPEKYQDSSQIYYISRNQKGFISPYSGLVLRKRKK